jgi:hypothetical protein
MDVSGSMNATDVQPTRLISSQRAATQFIEQLPDKFRVGIVSFASTAQTLTRPTTDRPAVYEAVASLHAEGATAMGDGIERALDVKRPPTPPSTGSDVRPAPNPGATGGDAPLIVLLLSDGANTQGRTQPMEAASDAKALGVPVFTIALGTDQGMVDVPDETGALRRIPVPPDKLTLQRIAETTGARFFAAPSSDDLKDIYRELGSKIGFRRHRPAVPGRRGDHVADLVQPVPLRSVSPSTSGAGSPRSRSVARPAASARRPSKRSRRWAASCQRSLARPRWRPTSSKWVRNPSRSPRRAARASSTRRAFSSTRSPLSPTPTETR